MVFDSSVAPAPHLTTALITFVCPQPNGRQQGRVTTDGFWMSRRHYFGASDLSIGTCKKHQHSRASCLVAPGFQDGLPHVLHAFAGFNPGGNHFCLCRSDNTCASEASCRNILPSGPACGVRWHCLVS